MRKRSIEVVVIAMLSILMLQPLSIYAQLFKPVTCAADLYPAAGGRAEVVIVYKQNPTSSWYAVKFNSSNVKVKSESVHSKYYFDTNYEMVDLSSQGSTTSGMLTWTITGDTTTVASKYYDNMQGWCPSSTTSGYLYTYAIGNAAQYKLPCTPEGGPIECVDYSGGVLSDQYKYLGYNKEDEVWINTSLDKAALFVVYRRVMAVTFNANGMTKYAQVNTDKQYVFDILVLPDVMDLGEEYADYITIQGWYDKSGNKIGMPGDTVILTAAKDLTLRYTTVGTAGYKATFVLTDELADCASISKSELYGFNNNQIQLSLCQLNDPDYADQIELAGWADEAGNIVGLPGEKITLTGNTTLHMVHTITKHTITFNAGAHGTCTTSRITTMLPVTLPDVKPQNGYNFIGWRSAMYDALVGRMGEQYPNGFKTLFYDDALEAEYEHTCNVLEWDVNSVTVEYLHAAATAETQTTHGTSVSNTLVNCAKDEGIYTLKVANGTLRTDEGGDLTITFKDVNGQVVSTFSLRIPVLVSTKEIIQNEHDRLLCASTDLVVLNGGVATNGSTPYSFRNIYIQGGGKLVVPSGTTLSTEQLYMRAGTLDSKGVYQFTYPQLVANGMIRNTSGIINYEYLLSDDHYYSLCLPFDVNVNDITYYDGSAMHCGSNLWITYYDGATRATGASGWKDFSGTQLQAGIGYTIAATPQSVVSDNNTSVALRYALIRLPMEASLQSGETLSDHTTLVTPYPASTGRDNDAGWNLVGNPFLANYGGQIEGLDSGNGIGLLVDDGAGGYVWSGSVRYVVIPDSYGLNYAPMLASNATLSAFNNFFVQIGSGDALTFSLANRAQKAPWHTSNVIADERMTGIVMAGMGTEDRVGVLIGDEYTREYEINADLQKISRNAGVNLYAWVEQGELSFVALNDTMAEYIPLGYMVPQAGEYTIRLDELYNGDSFSSVTLLDTETGQSVNLKQGEYSFVTSQITNNTRFVLSVMSLQTPTEMKLVKVVSPCDKWMQRGQLIIRKGDALFNAQGCRIK